MFPFDIVETNKDKIESYIRFLSEASSFIKCKHQPLPLMQNCPPLKLQLKANSVPVAVHKPAQIPIQWQPKVKEQLDTD